MDKEKGKETIKNNDTDWMNIFKKKEKINELKESIQDGISLSVTQDSLMDQDKCMIETDDGVIDCSLDTELDNLIRDIRSIAS